jgi:hypothetical protein
VQPRDPGRVGAQELCREVPQRADHGRLDQVDLRAQVVMAGLDLPGLGVTVARGAAFQDVRDEHIAALEPDLVEQLVEQLSGLSDERQPHPILVGPGRFANEHQVGVGVAGAEHDRRAGLVERAADAPRCLLEHGLQQLAALCGASHGVAC